MNKSYDRCLKIVKEIVAAMDDGYEVIWANEPKLLRWTWLAFKQENDQETTQSWSIRLSEVKRLSFANPCSLYLIAFITNKMNAKEALTAIERLEQLSAFW